MKNTCAALIFLALALGGCSRSLNQNELSDVGIRIRVRERLSDQPSLDLSRLTIDVHSRVVTISGIVHSEQERALIEEILNKTKGVDQALVNVLVQE